MSTVQEITQTTTSTTLSASERTDIMGKEDFLTLLVAQLQNQDPLNPDDPTEFTAQLAQFSSLEQLFNLNDSMDNLVTSNANADKFSTLQTIGKYVVYQGSEFEYDGKETVQLGYQLDGNATEVKITIKKDGQEIRTLTGSELDAGNHFLTWDGLDENGNSLGAGTYSIVISAKAAEGESIAASPLIKSEVTGVDLTGDYGGILQTKAGEVSFASILGVYEKNDSSEDDEDNEDDTEDDAAGIAFSSDSSSANSSVAFSTTTDSVQIKDDGKVRLKMNF